MLKGRGGRWFKSGYVHHKKQLSINQAEFEKLVKESILELPEKIRKKMDNCALCLEKRQTAEQLRKTG